MMRSKNCLRTRESGGGRPRRTVRTAVKALPAPRSPSRRRNVLIQVQGRLSPEALVEANRRLEELATFVAEQDDESREGFTCLTMAMSPAAKQG